MKPLQPTHLLAKYAENLREQEARPHVPGNAGELLEALELAEQYIAMHPWSPSTTLAIVRTAIQNARKP